MKGQKINKKQNKINKIKINKTGRGGDGEGVVTTIPRIQTTASTHSTIL